MDSLHLIIWLCTVSHPLSTTNILINYFMFMSSYRLHDSLNDYSFQTHKVGIVVQ